MALVLTVKEEGSLHLSTQEGEITVHIVEVRKRRVRVAIDAPAVVHVSRGELTEQSHVTRDICPATGSQPSGCLGGGELGLG